MLQPKEAQDKSASVEAAKFDKEYKIIIIGDAGAGKSSLFHQFRDGKFKKQSLATIGVEFGTKIITLQNEDRRRIKLNVWDTAGQERYRAVTRTYYRGAMGAVILFDITSAESFKHMPEWLQDAREQADSNIDIIAVGNKSDMKDQRQVSFMDATRWARDQGILLLETSAITGENVQEVFQILAQSIQARVDRATDSPKDVDRPEALALRSSTAKQSCCA